MSVRAYFEHCRSLIPEMEKAPVPLPEPNFPAGGLGGALKIYIKAFNRALNSKSIPQFSVEAMLAPAARAAEHSGRLFRACAGLLILASLAITLFNLQGAVGSLSGSFTTLATQTENVPAAKRVAPDAIGQAVVPEEVDTDRLLNGNSALQKQMANVSSAAATAFRIACGCILVALLFLIEANRREHQNRNLLAEFREIAHELYHAVLPFQPSLNQGDLAQRLNESAGAMSSAAEILREATSEMRQLSSLVASMTAVSEVIKSAMAQLPQDLRNSMNTVSTELVQGLTSSLGESNEHTLKILHIYGEQELRIKELHDYVVAVRQATDKIQLAATDVANASRSVDSSVQKTSASTAGLVQVTQKVAEAIEKLPLSELRSAFESVHVLTQTMDDIRQNANSLIDKLESAIQSDTAQRSALAKSVGDIKAGSQKLFDFVVAREGTEFTPAQANYLMSLMDYLVRELRSTHSSSNGDARGVLTRLEDLLKVVERKTRIGELPEDVVQ